MKKRILISIFIFNTILTITAQNGVWTSTTNTLTTKSKVGIGTGYAGNGNLIPIEKLTIGQMGGNFAVQDRRTSVNGNFSSGYKFYDYYGESASILLEHNGYFGNVARSLNFFVNGTNRIKINHNGNVGIGTTTPGAKLHVNNGNNSYGSILANANEYKFSLYTKTLSTSPVDTESFRLGLKYDTDERNGFISFYRGRSSGGGFLGFSTNGNERLRINRDGKIGIGTSNTGSHRLAVEGSIGAREIKVEANTWSDFVFEKNYKLPTLKEVETHIKEKGHLKDIPSAKEVEKNGIFLGEMNAKLLQKIEELTLYTIAQEKKLNIQKIDIKNLKEEKKSLKIMNSKLLELQTRLEKLESKK